MYRVYKRDLLTARHDPSTEYYTSIIEIIKAESAVFKPLQMQSCIYYSMSTMRRTKRAVYTQVLYPFLKKKKSLCF